MYSVYKHTNKINSKVYIGLTGRTPEKRWANGLGYKPKGKNQSAYFYNAILKYGWDNFTHEILYTELTKQQAERIEIFLIGQYKSNQREFGYNIDNGGNCRGKMSEETKKKISESWSENRETRSKKISDGKKGYKFTEEHKKHLSEAKKGRKANNRKPVDQYSFDMEFIKHWDSLEDVQCVLGICKANICRAIRTNKTAGGYRWKY